MASTGRIASACFNGAAPARARKLHQAGANPIARLMLQRGRARAGAEIGPSTEPSIVAAMCFNGAAPARARNERVWHRTA